MADDDKKRSNKILRDLLKKYEGSSEKAYVDPGEDAGKSIGVGSSLRNPTTIKAIKDKGYNFEDVKQGKTDIKPEDIEDLLDKNIKDTEYSIPKGSNLTPEQKAAIQSMTFQGGEKLAGEGTEFRKKLKAGDTVGAAREVLLRSNPRDVGGITRRNIETTKLISGEKWNEVLDSLTKEDLDELRKELKTIKSKPTLENTRKANPILFEKLFPKKK